MYNMIIANRFAICRYKKIKTKSTLEFIYRHALQKNVLSPFITISWKCKYIDCDTVICAGKIFNRNYAMYSGISKCSNDNFPKIARYLIHNRTLPTASSNCKLLIQHRANCRRPHT